MNKKIKENTTKKYKYESIKQKLSKVIVEKKTK